MDDKKVVFVNKKVFNQIDWDKNIEKSNVHKLSQDTIVKRLSMALTVFTLSEQTMKIEESDEEHKKSNVCRMLQYFYAKFIYYHAYLYKNSLKYKVDLKPKEKSSREEKKFFLDTNFKKSNLPFKDIRTIEKILQEHVKKIESANKQEVLSKTEYYNQVKDLFTQVGFKVTKPRGIRKEKEKDRDTVCVRHDGIPYHIYMMRESQRTDIRDLNLAQDKKVIFDEFIERYHDLVKRIFLEIKKLPGMRNLWVMEGGGMQHQAFFGNENGYIGILYLGMKGEKDKDITYTFTINGKENDKTLSGLKVEGMKVKTHKSIWGNK